MCIRDSARGGIQWVLAAGGMEAVRTVGMLAATHGKEVAGVSRARVAVEALVPLNIDAPPPSAEPLTPTVN
eukprot:607960-Rhodomonas_salina.1